MKSFLQSTLRSLLKALSSLKLAVFIIVVFAVLTAVGTIIESKYDAIAASKWIYRTPWMFGVMILLAINLIAVMVDRWPWKQKHIPFILAHIGILVLLLGSLVTFLYGLDGTLRVAENEKNRFVTTSDTDLVIWSSFDGSNYTKLFEEPVDFFLHSPKEKPIEISVDHQKKIKISDYKPYALVTPQIRESDDPRAGLAVRFNLSNERVHFTDWLMQRRRGDIGATLNLGPAKIIIGEAPKSPTGQNEIYLSVVSGAANAMVDAAKTPKSAASATTRLKYTIYSRDTTHKTMTGFIKETETIKTPWMNLEFKLLRLLPQAQQFWDFKFVERPTPLTTAAVLVEFNGRQDWVQIDDVFKLFDDNIAYIISYGHRRIDMGFDITLKKFEVGRYQGTQRAATYQSWVDVPGVGERLISMNEPLKHKGLTVYQASFQEGPDGVPVASIFSVNNDPGRWLKYLGSLIISLGVAWLFIHKRKSSRAQAPQKIEEVLQ